MSVSVTGVEEVKIKLESLAATTGEKADKALRVYGFQLLALAQMRSPVAPGSGRFKGAWQITENVNPSALASIMLSNPMVYGPVLEYGSKKGELPWRKPGPRTMLAGDRVRSKQAPDGVLTPFLPKMATEAAKAVFEAIEVS
jgi:hypothetical protein